MSRRRYSLEFRNSAVQMVVQRGQTVKQTAHGLGIPPTTLKSWVQQSGAHSGPSGEVEVLRAQLAALQRVNERLQTERDILKKAAAFFAREQP